MKPILSFIVWIKLLLVVKGSFYPAHSNVTVLDAHNFAQFVGTNDYDVSVVQFYADWCGHCQALKPEYIKAAKALKGLVGFYAVDGSQEQNKGLAQKFHIRGFPIIKVFVGSQMLDYNGERTANALKRFAYEILPSFAKPLTAKTVIPFLQQDQKEKPRALILSTTQSTSPIIKRLSAILKDYVSFGEVRNKNTIRIAKQFNVNFNNIQESGVLLMFPKETNVPHMFNLEKASFQELKSLLYPYVEELRLIDQLPVLADESCFQEKCVKKGLCVILVVGEDGAAAKSGHDILKKIQEEHDVSAFSFVQIDARKEQVWLNSLFDQSDKDSGIWFLDPTAKKYSKYIGPFETEPILNWLASVRHGVGVFTFVNELPKLSNATVSCKPESDKPKFEDIHWTVAEPHKSSTLLQLNTTNFQQIILESNQPAIVEFYAPWCEHCQTLAPHFVRTSIDFKGMVLFGVVDCNEGINKELCSKYDIRGYPTLKIFPAGYHAKHQGPPQDYLGPRTTEAIEKELKKVLRKVKVATPRGPRELEDLKNNNKGKAKVLLLGEIPKPPEIFHALAAKFENVSFAVVNQKELIKSLGVVPSGPPRILAYSENNEVKEIDYLGQTFEKLDTFVQDLTKKEVVPPMETVTVIVEENTIVKTETHIYLQVINDNGTEVREL